MKLKLFITGIILALLVTTGFAQGRVALKNAYLQSDLNANGQNITNLSASFSISRATVTNALTGTITNSTTGNAATATYATNFAGTEFNVNTLNATNLIADAIYGNGGGLSNLNASALTGNITGAIISPFIVTSNAYINLGTSTNLPGTNITSVGASAGQILTATASGAAWSNAPAGSSVVAPGANMSVQTNGSVYTVVNNPSLFTRRCWFAAPAAGTSLSTFGSTYQASGSVIRIAPTASTPQFLRCNTSSGIGNTATFVDYDTTRLNGKNARFKWFVGTTNTAETRMTVGLHELSSLALLEDPTNTVRRSVQFYFNGTNHANWFFITSDAGNGYNITSLGIAADTTNHFFEIEFSGPSVIGYYDNVAVVTNTTKIPTAALYGGVGVTPKAAITSGVNFLQFYGESDW